jgi:hypothetical protein
MAAAVAAGWSQLAGGAQDKNHAAAPAASAGSAGAPSAAAGGGGMAVAVFEVYQASRDEFISSMHATTDGRYLVLRSKVQVSNV